MATQASQTYQIGSLVRVRDRDWVVLPSTNPEILKLRPLSGSEAEISGIHLRLEGDSIKPVNFPPPDPQQAGDFVSGRLLRDAARLSLRRGAGPFRSLGQIGVRPRPYQFVPLIMALRLDCARLLIADDVGVGKTIEAALIARELLDRGDAHRLCVLCPPHLCDQWQRELENKFSIPAVIVRTSTHARLERTTPKHLSIFQYYPYIVVSIDFAKSVRHRPLFLEHCPELVIVDEVHTAAEPGPRSSRVRQQRHELIKEIAQDRNRHLLLMTATPHSGVQESFLSLIGLLNPQFRHFEMGSLSEQQRRRLARHFVQRTRGDVKRWMGVDTPFPERIPPYEETYRLSPDYRSLFDDVLAFTRETVKSPGLSKPRQRARYWAALALLRCLMSSPAAAAKALSRREKALAEGGEESELEGLRQREMLDALLEEGTVDAEPEAAVQSGSDDLSKHDKSRLAKFRARAEAIAKEDKDNKIIALVKLIGSMLREAYHPVVYCRYVATAEYVAKQLEERLRKEFSKIHAVGVTSKTGDDGEREVVIKSLVESPVRVLVATDCLSEGINLQDDFDAVVHYDLPWNPNRLDQREGRIDRFGQKRAEVRTVRLFSPDSPIDGIVLNVLVRKVEQIYRETGIRVSVPIESESVEQAIVSALLEDWRGTAQQLPLGYEGMETVQNLHSALDQEAKREKESRARFAQHRIQPDEVEAELKGMDAVLGDPQVVRMFLLGATERLQIRRQDKGRYVLLDPATLPQDLRNRLQWKKPVRLVFDALVPEDLEDAVVVGRNHPLVVYLSDTIFGLALSPRSQEDFTRCGAIYTSSVKTRTVLSLLRVRYRLTRRGKPDQFAEEIITAGYQPDGEDLSWYGANSSEVLALLEEASPVASISPKEKFDRLRAALTEIDNQGTKLQQIANGRAEELKASYERLKQQIGGAAVQVHAYPPDILGVYVLLPGGAA